MKQLHKQGQEKLRGKIMEMVKQNLKTLKAASLELGISYSQAKRIYPKCQLIEKQPKKTHIPDIPRAETKRETA
jgi:hypothetical protein